MSFDIDIDDDDIKRVRGEIDKIKLKALGLGKKIANDVADWIVIQTKNNIYQYGLYVSGDLYNSVQKYDLGDSIEIRVEAPYAAPLERGAQPSPGRYVPDIDRRLVNPTRGVIKWGTENEIIEIENPLGMHPGNREYRFFGNAIDDVLAYTDDTWLSEQTERELNDE